jgi:hypothetical protein
MWSLLPKTWQVGVIGLVSYWFLSMIVYLYQTLTGAATEPWKWISMVGTIIVVAILPMVNWLWFKIVNSLPVCQRMTFPDLNGSWEGHLESNWINPETNARVDPIPAKITIRQGIIHTSVTLQTKESRSESTRVFLERFPEVGRFRIWYSYNNDPIAQVRHRSTEHEGVAFLDLHWDEDRNRLRGRYYTARPTTGSIDIKRQDV